MNKCTEKTQRWPDALTDVPHDEIDAFRAHAEVCPFHAEKLLAEEEEVLSVFRLARGLNSHGRILRGKELKEEIAEHERRQSLWQEAAQRETLPFRRIYLSNCGEDIAGSGKFYDFLKYEGEHPLDPKAGLQIWGVLGEGKGKEILLGFYPLAGVRHSGEEKLLPLNNGYTVGLKVEQLGERRFKIEFRCVENEVLEAEQTGLTQTKKIKKQCLKALSAGKSFFAIARNCFASLIYSPELMVPRFTAGIGVVIFLVIAVNNVALRQKRDVLPEGHIPVPDSSATKGIYVMRDTSSSVTTRQTALTEETKIADRPRRQTMPTEPRPATRNNQGAVKPPRGGSTVRQEGAAVKSQDGTNETDHATAALLPIANPLAQTEPPDSAHRQAWYLKSILIDGTNAPKMLVIHSGSDEILGAKLFAEIHQRDFGIEPISEESARVSPPNQFTVAWSILREEKSVTVKATLTTNGESKVLTFRSDGACIKQACEKAVRDAVSGVFAVMQDLTIAE